MLRDGGAGPCAAVVQLSLPQITPQLGACTKCADVCTQEDAQLIELVDQYGPMNWSLIAQQLHSVPPRNGKSCRLRWCARCPPAAADACSAGALAELQCLTGVCRVRAGSTSSTPS